MKLVIISDTHNEHWKLPLLSGDVLIHCGDITTYGQVEQIASFDNWMSTLPFKYKLVIGGNHDIDLQKHYTMLQNCTYLEDSGIEIDGVRFWGSPVNGMFGNWAFNDKTEERIDKIPYDTDVLITHAPPFGVLDQLSLANIDSGKHVGLESLLTKVYQIQPKIHCFGHIHESYGTEYHDDIKFYNAAMQNENGEMMIGNQNVLIVHKPIVIEI